MPLFCLYLCTVVPALPWAAFMPQRDEALSFWYFPITPLRASQVALVVKKPPANAGDIRDTGSIPGSGRSPGGAWQCTPVFLPAESHGQRSLVSYSPWGCKRGSQSVRQDWSDLARITPLPTKQSVKDKGNGKLQKGTLPYLLITRRHIDLFQSIYLNSHWKLSQKIQKEVVKLQCLQVWTVSQQQLCDLGWQEQT